MLAGCQVRRPDFLARIQADCAAGEGWACDLLDALAGAEPAADSAASDRVKDDVDAILKGIDRARSAPHVGYLEVPPITGELPFLATITTLPPLQTIHRAGDFGIGPQT